MVEVFFFFFFKKGLNFSFRLWIGPTAALNVLGAFWLSTLLGPGHNIVTILCDSANSYLVRLLLKPHSKQS